VDASIVDDVVVVLLCDMGKDNLECIRPGRYLRVLEEADVVVLVSKRAVGSSVVIVLVVVSLVLVLVVLVVEVTSFKPLTILVRICRHTLTISQ
jgi:hypothetical protein